MFFPLKPPYTPELLAGAQVLIQEFLDSVPMRPRVLELGSGYSTIWFASQAVVTSLEHDKEWFAAVEPLVECMYLLRAPEDFVPTVASLQASSYNLLYVDCIDEQRVPCLEAALPKLASGALVVLDDSHWDLLQPAKELLACYRNETIYGDHTRKTGEVKYHQTTFYYLP